MLLIFSIPHSTSTYESFVLFSCTHKIGEKPFDTETEQIFLRNNSVNMVIIFTFTH
jgi:hypothetical protein